MVLSRTKCKDPPTIGGRGGGRARVKGDFVKFSKVRGDFVFRNPRNELVPGPGYRQHEAGRWHIGISEKEMKFKHKLRWGAFEKLNKSNAASFEGNLSITKLRKVRIRYNFAL